MKKAIGLSVVVLLVLLLSLTWAVFYDKEVGQENVAELIKVSSSGITAGNSSFGQQAPAGEKNIVKNGSSFEAPDGRTMYLRGINVSGSSKMPMLPYTVSHVNKDFFDGANVSFVGRPFPLEDADRHFKRLKKWGFHVLRFLITWEAIEHKGPGIYDQEYLDYLAEVVKLSAKYGFNVFIDPHQDVWSRYSGGSGAPLWTFDVAGLKPTSFSETGAAFVHNLEGDPLPSMIWFTNNSKLAAASMWTLFFGGNDFAPNYKVENKQAIQDFLQTHFNQAMLQVAQRLKNQANVIGFEYINEPASGFIGLKDLTQPFTQDLFGAMPTPAQSMYLGDGIPQTVATATLGPFGIEPGPEALLNQKKLSAWSHQQGGLWKQHGVWGLSEDGAPTVLKPHYFSKIQGRNVDFSEDYLKPAINAYADIIHSVDPDWLIFVEPALFPSYTPLPVWDESRRKQMVNAKHWYDDVTLVTKRYWPFLGVNAETGEMEYGVQNVRVFIEKLLASFAKETETSLGNAPTLVGETGIPYDMNASKAFTNNDFSEQARAADRVFNALEKNLLHYTWWNYTADNSNARGDQWNGEDLSIFSVDQQYDNTDINSGGRALDAVVRPYPYKVAGEILEYRFNRKYKEFVLKFKPTPGSDKPVEIFLPAFHYDKGFDVFSEASTLAFDKDHDMLLLYPDDTSKEQLLVIRGRQAP